VSSWPPLTRQSGRFTRVYDKVLRFDAGRPLLGTVDLDAGY
jgi:hypothetical protein